MIDTSRQMAADFLALAEGHEAPATKGRRNLFAEAVLIAKHMARGGSYSYGDRDIVYTQFRKLQSNFA